MIHLLQNKVLVVIKFLNISIIKNCIPMSHWRLTMVDGAQFWISYQQLAFLSIPGRNLQWCGVNVTSEGYTF